MRTGIHGQIHLWGYGYAFISTPTKITQLIDDIGNNQ